MAVQACAGPVEGDPAVHSFERVRQREMSNPSTGNRGAARQARCPQGPGHIGLEIGLARAADVPEEPLQDPQVGGAGRMQRNLTFGQWNAAGDLQTSTFTNEPHLRHVHLVTF